MSSAAALNRPQWCAQELSDFERSMGWSFQDLTLHDDAHEDEEDEAVDRVHRDLKLREHTHTAFDKRVEILADFVAPRQLHARPTSAAASSESEHQPHQSKKTKQSAVHSAAYSKRATGPTAAARHPPVPSQLAATERSSRHSHSHNRSSHSRLPPPPRDGHRVDFVYDVHVRRALRDQMDAERLATLREAKEKEARLRAARRWVADADDGHKSGDGRKAASTRKQAWLTAGSGTSTHVSHEAATTARPASPVKSALGIVRPVSAKTAIAPNVSEWRTQETPFHAPTPAAQRAQRRVREQQKLTEQWREAAEVARALDAFDAQPQQPQQPQLWTDNDSSNGGPT